MITISIEKLILSIILTLILFENIKLINSRYVKEVVKWLKK